jgi:hypothetical protein
MYVVQPDPFAYVPVKISYFWKLYDMIWDINFNLDDVFESFLASNNVAHVKMFPITNLDCAEDHGSLSSAHFCAILDMECNYAKGVEKETLCSPDNCLRNHGETLMTFETNHKKMTPVLVGFSSAKNYCNLEKPLVFTRISVYRDWIEQVLNLSDEFLECKCRNL